MPEELEWDAFMANAIGGLRASATAMRAEADYYEGRRGWFRPVQIEIPHEDSVTSALVEEFRKLRSAEAIKGHAIPGISLRHIEISKQDRRPLDPGIGPNDNPTDYMFTMFSDTLLEFRIEAKTIVNRGDIRAEYLGARGMLRFEDGNNPYTLAPFGGMLAYVVDLDAPEWSRMIGEELRADIGADRVGQLRIGETEHLMSSHVCVPAEQGENGTALEIAVVHFALEIDARPRRR
jgi:hypothetical protein